MNHRSVCRSLGLRSGWGCGCAHPRALETTLHTWQCCDHTCSRIKLVRLGARSTLHGSCAAALDGAFKGASQSMWIWCASLPFSVRTCVAALIAIAHRCHSKHKQAPCPRWKNLLSSLAYNIVWRSTARALQCWMQMLAKPSAVAPLKWRWCSGTTRDPVAQAPFTSPQSARCCALRLLCNFSAAADPLLLLASLAVVLLLQARGLGWQGRIWHPSSAQHCIPADCDACRVDRPGAQQHALHIPTAG